MDLERRLDIETPDGVPVSLTLAGVGSRMIAASVDALITVVVMALTVLGLALTLGFEDGGTWAAAVIGVMFLFLFVFAPAAFETLADGRTPGKMAVGLRVVHDDGRPLEAWPAIVRNLARFVDFLPALYAVGLITMLVTRREQRLGDLMAGTLVVRDRVETRPLPSVTPPPGPPWDVRLVTDEEFDVIRRYLEREQQLTHEAATKLASSIAVRLRPRVSGAPPTVDDRTFVRGVYAFRSFGSA